MIDGFSLVEINIVTAMLDSGRQEVCRSRSMSPTAQYVAMFYLCDRAEVKFVGG